MSFLMALPLSFLFKIGLLAESGALFWLDWLVGEHTGQSVKLFRALTLCICRRSDKVYTCVGRLVTAWKKLQRAEGA